MTKIQTVRGPIDSSQLGTTLMHEHVFVLDTEILQNYPEEWGQEEKRIADAVARLNELKARGVDAIVDLTVIGQGRYIPRIQRIAEQTQIHIVVATGIYTYCDLPFYFHFRGPGTVLGGPELITEMFVRDINEGIANTRVKAGILKCATDEPEVTKDVERVLRAIAQAHRQTGVPISTHTHARKRVGVEQQRIFREERVNTVASRCKREHAAKMVLSHDAACYNHWLPERPLPAILPRWHYLHIHNDVIPALKQKGVTDAHLRAMLVENPRQI